MIDTFGFSIILPIFGLPFIVANKYSSTQAANVESSLFMGLSQVSYLSIFLSFKDGSETLSNCNMVLNISLSISPVSLLGLLDVWARNGGSSYGHYIVCYTSKTAFDGNYLNYFIFSKARMSVV